MRYKSCSENKSRHNIFIYSKKNGKICSAGWQERKKFLLLHSIFVISGGTRLPVNIASIVEFNILHTNGLD